MCDIFSPGALLGLFVIFFVITFIYIFKRDIVFSFFYLLLFLYTIFSEIAYLYYPYSIAQFWLFVGSLQDLCKYQLFVRGSFVSIVVFFLVFDHYHAGKHLRRVLRTHRHGNLFFLLNCSFIMGLLFLFLMNEGSISYYDQGGLKEDTLFRNMWELSGMFVLLLYAILQTPMSASRRFVARVFLISIISVILIISVKAGQREYFLTLPLGWFVYTLLSGRDNQPQYWLWVRVAFLAAIALIMALTLQFERRNPDANIFSYLSTLSKPNLLLEDYLFSLEGLLLQDYTGPSFLLLSSIKHDLVYTWRALESVILGCIPLTRVPSLGLITAQIVNPALAYSWQGYGYYFPNEGFAIAGWIGMVYNGLVLNLGYWMWRLLFMDVDDNNFRSFVGALMAMKAIDVIRGQSSMFFREALLVIIPAIVLYYLATGRRPKYFASKTQE